MKHEPMTLTNKKMSKKNIKYGEVYWGRLPDAEGYEQQNERPLAIVSHNKQNQIGKLLIVVPLSRSIEKIYPFQVATFFNGESGKAKCEQVRAITSERLERKLGNLTDEEMKAISDRLLLILNLVDNISNKQLLTILQKRIREGTIKINN